MKDRQKRSADEFHKYYLDSSVPGMVRGLIITLILFLLFTILDKIIFPHSEKKIFFHRFGVIAPFIIASIIVVSIKGLQKSREFLLTWINFLTGFAIFAVGAFMNPRDPGYEYYFVWTSLVILGIHTFYRIRLHNLAIIGSFILISFIAANLYNKTYLIRPEEFVNDMFFVIAMSVLGFFISYTIEQLKLNDFRLQMQLKTQYDELLTETRKKKIAEDAYHHTEKLYHDSLDSIPDWIYIVDRNYRIVFYNKAFENVCIENGYSPYMIGKRISTDMPVFHNTTLEEIQAVFDSGSINFKEEKLTIADRIYCVQRRKIPIYKENEIIQVMVIIQDISKKMELEELKQKSAEQKEILLKEIHHRVKNNLAIVISLLSLQMRKYNNPEIIKVIRDIECRIRSMALIHENLYKSENLDRIPLANYLRSLSMSISSTLCPPHVRILNDLIAIDVSIETAMPLGLITNELLTNSCKYGFPDQQDGSIMISLAKCADDPGKYQLCIKDDGVGLPSGFLIDQVTTLGMFIVRILAQQLNAQLFFENKNGTSFTLVFSEAEMKVNKLPT